MKRFDYEPLIVSFGHPQQERLEIAFSALEIERFRRSIDDWLLARITVAAGGFSGEAELWFEAADFACLLPNLRRLYDMLRGDVDFKTVEDQLRFRLTGDGRGHIALRGHLLDGLGDGNRLDFTLKYDQTLLWHSIAEIIEFLAATVDSKDVQ
jgi:hypothetical protein